MRDEMALLDLHTQVVIPLNENGDIVSLLSVHKVHTLTDT